MDEDLRILWNYAAGQHMEKYAKKYKYFYSHEEYEANKHEIWKINAAKTKLMKKLKN